MAFPPTDGSSTTTTQPTVTTPTSEVLCNSNLNVTDSILNFNGSAADIKCPTAVITSIPAVVGTSVLLLPVNNLRRTFIVVNNTVTGIMKIAFGLEASSTNFTLILYPGDTLLWETFSYTGPLACIWDVADGTAQVTEII
jgi:hypothetical protein